MFKWIKRRRLIDELNTEYFMMSIFLRKWIAHTEQYLKDDGSYNKKELRREMIFASEQCTIHEESVRRIIKELREL